MKIDLTSLSFNSILKEGVGTPSWGTALGQTQGYNITVDGANDMLLGMFNNKVDDSKLQHNIRGNKEILITSCFKDVYINNSKIDCPFILTIVLEHTESHDGRKSIKYNDSLKLHVNNELISNESFYLSAQNYFGKNACWFAYEFTIINGKELNINAVLVSDNPVTYLNSKHRKEEWSKLVEIKSSSIAKINAITKHKVIGQFVFNVLEHLVNENKLDRFIIFLIRNPDNRFASIIKGESKLTSMFWVFEKYPSDEQLTQGDKIRAFNKISFEVNNLKYFLSKEWTDQTGHRLDINNFISIINSTYPDLNIFKLDDEYFLCSNLVSLNINLFYKNCIDAKLYFSLKIIKRLIISLCNKQFVICSGLSGSGKTKLAQAFVSWICASPSQYKIIPVGADWTNREPILGYPNGLDNSKYESPESGALQIVLDAIADMDKPYFLILDEMNLSHVERYFADFLSVMESNDTIKLHAGGEKLDSRDNKIKNEISWPDNLFIIGTVNIDETTYMFSPKVLDRANVIEFRIQEDEMEAFLGNSQKPDMKKLFVDNDKEKGGLGQSMATDFLNKARDKEIERSNEDEQNVIKQTLYAFFVELQAVGAEYGYRTASEIELLLYKLSSDIPDLNERLDIAIMQKMLPKLHGSRKKLIAPLETLAGFCIDDSVLSVSEKGRDLYKKWAELKDDDLKKNSIRFKISFDKIMRMHNNAMQNGYTSYAEA